MSLANLEASPISFIFRSYTTLEYRGVQQIWTKVHSGDIGYSGDFFGKSSEGPGFLIRTISR